MRKLHCRQGRCGFIPDGNEDALCRSVALRCTGRLLCPCPAAILRRVAPYSGRPARCRETDVRPPARMRLIHALPVDRYDESFRCGQGDVDGY